MPAAAPPALPVDFPGKIQKISPAAARFCLTIARFVKSELNLPLVGQRVLIGFSGGADSTALLLVLHFLAPQLHLRLSAAHLDHALRPSSAQEAEACVALCKQLGIPCLVERVEVEAMAKKWKTGTEESARKARYAFYERALKRSGSTLLALGHQNNDLAEDILMRLIRGTGWPSLGGMPGTDQRRNLVRPLLLTPRRNLEDFLAGLGVSWVYDTSNEDPAYFRNRVRNTILPLLLRENPSFLQTAANLWRLARIDAGYFAEILSSTAPLELSGKNELAAEKRTAKRENAPPPDGAAPAVAGIIADAATQCMDMEITTPAQTLLAWPQAIRLRFYKQMLESMGPGQVQLSGLFSLDHAWLANSESTTHMLPGNKEALVKKRAVTWKKRKTK